MNGALRWALRHSRFMLLPDAGHDWRSMWSCSFIVPKGFFPEQDTGRITGNIQAAQDISFQAMEREAGRRSWTSSRPTRMWSM